MRGGVEGVRVECIADCVCHRSGCLWGKVGVEMGASIDTLSLPYTQGTDLSVQVMGQIKLSLSLSHRPPRITILCKGGHQTRRYVWINLLVPRMCAAMSGMETIGYSQPRDKHDQKLSRTLSRGV